MAKQWIQDNMLKIVVAAAAIIAAYAVLTDNVRTMRPLVVANEKAIVAVEKDIIGIKGSVEALRIQQEGYHTQQNTKLDLILDRLPP